MKFVVVGGGGRADGGGGGGSGYRIKNKNPTQSCGEITPFEAHMQEKMQFIAYLRGFVNIQDPRHLKTGFFSFKISLISFPIKDGKLEKKQGPKVTGKK